MGIRAQMRIDDPRSRPLTIILVTLGTPKIAGHAINTDFEVFHGRANSMIIPRGQAKRGGNHTCTGRAAYLSCVAGASSPHHLGCRASSVILPTAAVPAQTRRPVRPAQLPPASAVLALSYLVDGLSDSSGVQRITCASGYEPSFAHKPPLCNTSPESRFVLHATLAKSLP